MEGPTPVSALIHAATMVTAGVYLIVRSGAIFELSADRAAGRDHRRRRPRCSPVRSSVAPRTTSRRASPGSTMSQIGYMMLAAGIGTAGYAFAIAHLITHGFFKAGLFLGAGSVMHGMNDEVDMRKYGGLRTVMPITCATFVLGYLAIIGFPLLSGCFTKDGIIETAFARAARPADPRLAGGDRRGHHRRSTCRG